MTLADWLVPRSALEWGGPKGHMTREFVRTIWRVVDRDTGTVIASAPDPAALWGEYERNREDR